MKIKLNGKNLNFLGNTNVNSDEYEKIKQLGHIEGCPRSTNKHTWHELKNMGFVGFYKIVD